MANTRENPYVGPRAFRIADQKMFAGRDRDILALYRLLTADRIVLLFSPSGAGKSSIVNAGLLPRMIERGFKVFPVVRVNHPLPDGLADKGIANRYVMSVLQSLEVDRSSRRDVPSAAHIQAGEQAFSTEQLATLTIDAYLTQRLRPDGPSDDEEEEIVEPRSLLIFDQFEEILTINPNDHKAKLDFFAQLGEALAASRRWALFVVREDYVAALEPYRRFLPTRLSQTYRLDLLDDQSAMEAIRKPASLNGMKYTDAAAQHLVDELRKVRIQTPNGEWEPEPQLGRYVEPVQLQVVCSRLWGKVDEDDTITEEEVSDLGSVDESLAEFYADKVNETAGKVGIAEKDIRSWFDTALITPTNIRSQVMWEKDESGGIRNDAILYLEKTHLIRRESRRGIMWLELAHDRLIKPVRDDNQKWFEKNLAVLQRQAMTWQAQGRPEHLLLRYEALKEAEKWAKKNQNTLSPVEEDFLKESQNLRARLEAESSKRRTRIISWIAAIMGLLLIFAVAASVIAFQQRALARDETALAQAQRDRAETAEALAEEKAIEADTQKKRAENASLVSRASQLAAQSILSADSEPKRAILLALEALEMTQREGKPAVPAAEEALRTALSSQSGLLLSGHTGQIKSVAVSDDEHWLATADNRGFIRIWDLTATVPSESKLLLRDLEGEPIIHIELSRDSQYLVAGGERGTIGIWSLPEELGQQPEEKPLYIFGDNLNPDVEERISALTLSPDGAWLAAGGSNGTAKLYDLTSFADPVTLVSSGVKQITVLEFSPDSTRLAAGSEDYLVRLWTVSKPQSTPVSAVTRGPVLDVDFSPDGAYLAIGADQIIHFWNVNAPSSKLDTYQKTASRITTLAFNPAEATAPNGSKQQQLFVGHADGSIEVWRGSRNTFDIPSEAEISRAIDSEITHFSFSPDGKWLLTASKDRLARLFDATGLNSAPHVLRRFGEPITAAVISPQGTWIAVSSDNNEARLWNLEAGFDTVEPLTLPGEAFALDREGSMLVTAPVSDTLPPVLTWNLADLDQLQKVPSSIASDDAVWVGMNTVTISPDGHWLVTCDWDGSVQIKDLQDNTAPLKMLKGGSNDDNQLCRRAEFTPDGRYLIAVEDNYDEYRAVIQVWDTSQTDFANTAPRTIDAHEGSNISLAFSTDGKWMATGSDGGEAYEGVAVLWDLNDLSSGKPVLTIPGHYGYVNTVAFSPDGRWLATGDDNGDIRLQDLTDLQTPPIPVHAHDDWVNVVTFSPDSKYVASGGADGIIYSWPVLNEGDDPVVFAFRGHEGPVWDLVFSPDNKQLASASSDNTVRLWDWSTRSREAVVLKGYQDTVTRVDFTSDGGWLVTGSNDGTTRLWHIGLDRLRELACQVAGRNLSQREWNQFINSGAVTSQGIEYRKTCPDYELVYNAESDEFASAYAPSFLIPVTADGGGGSPQPETCSVSANVAVNLTFTNNSEREVDMYWVDYNCELVFYGTLLPGDRYSQASFATHPWMFIDAETRAVLKGDFVAGTTDEQVAIP